MRRKAVKRTLQPWTYVQAAVPKETKDIIEAQAETEGVSVAEVAGRVLTAHAKHRDGWQGKITQDIEQDTAAIFPPKSTTRLTARIERVVEGGEA